MAEATRVMHETPQESLSEVRQKRVWQEELTKEEVRELLQPSDWRAWWTIACNWIGVGLAFALVAWAPNPLTVVVALFVIGTRQLGFAIVMHEAAHYALFENRKLNDWAGNWLAAYPIWSDTKPYRRYHLQHHAKTGTEEDPDLGLVAAFPITRKSFARKVWRDLSGQTGWKQLKAVWRRDMGTATKRTQRNSGLRTFEAPMVGWRIVAPVFLTNAVLLGILALCGHPELYLLWVVAFLTTYRLVMRIRSIAEHAMTEDATDPLLNTRTTLASWWERLLIAPNRVNYHLEHHLLMTVPLYNLPKMHELLKERGVLDHANVARGYWQVLTEATSRPA
jgi:fatty acid desaturase